MKSRDAITRCFWLPADRDSEEYRGFWAALNRGESQSAEFKRIGKNGREVWIEASYNPVLGVDRKPVKVVKLATEITQKKSRGLANASRIAAIDRSQAVIEFKLDGTIITANENFLQTVGYTLEEIRGQHHRMFMPAEDRDSAAYREFWAALNRGEYRAAEFKRVGKGGKDVWILASYNPVFDETGRPIAVVKFATDITAQKTLNADLSGQMAAIRKSQAVIEFNMDGTIITANDNFLNAVGYSLEEIQGQHHRKFVEPAEQDSSGYREFWASLNRGEYRAAEYKRIAKGGREIYIQASYNPIFDLNNKPFKVVKYATDTTKQVLIRIGNEHIRSMMDSVAVGAEQLSASVQEIAGTMARSKERAIGAVERVATADTQAQRLTAAAHSMRGIVDLINKITGQINLLALNATIESARAGDAGRGFAVVAAEVKSLANQAKRATDKIDHEIGSLNSISGDVGEALIEIKQAINAVSEYVTSTAAAVEEQSAVSAQMSGSIRDAAREAAAIAS